MSSGHDDDVVVDSRSGVLLSRLEADWHDPYALGVVALGVIALILVLRGLHLHEPELAGVGVAGLFATRGFARGRRVLAWHAVLAVVLVGGARLCAVAGHSEAALIATVAVGPALVLPRRAPRPSDATARRHVWSLVDQTSGDAVAPFALRTDKSHVLSADGRAAVAYRVRFGTAVASGDPVGAAESRDAAVAAFFAHAQASGWRTAVLASHEDHMPLWRRHGLRAVPIGRDVLIDVGSFAMTGRRFRNLRQAVQRTHNAGVTTEVVAESALDEQERSELLAVMARSGRGEEPRGFAMILDHVLDAVHPGTYVALARDRDGRTVAFQRFASADGGRELSLDLPFRRPDAPNGVDERLAVDMVAWARDHGARHLSLAFAPFPELFAQTERSLFGRLAYWGVHRLDRLIRVESLYRFVRKFNAFGGRRYIALRPWEVVWVAAAMLTLEFGPNRARQR